MPPFGVPFGAHDSAGEGATRPLALLSSTSRSARRQRGATQLSSISRSMRLELLNRDEMRCCAPTSENRLLARCKDVSDEFFSSAQAIACRPASGMLLRLRLMNERHEFLFRAPAMYLRKSYISKPLCQEVLAIQSLALHSKCTLLLSPRHHFQRDSMK